MTSDFPSADSAPLDFRWAPGPQTLPVNQSSGSFDSRNKRRVDGSLVGPIFKPNNVRKFDLNILLCGRIHIVQSLSLLRRPEKICRPSMSFTPLIKIKLMRHQIHLTTRAPLSLLYLPNDFAVIA